jgi:Tfp pilus assembly protein PilO
MEERIMMASPNASRQFGWSWIDAAGIGACVLATLIAYLTLVGPFLQKRSAAADLRRAMDTQQKKAADVKSALATAQAHLAAVQQHLAASTIQLELAAHVNRRIAGVTEFFSSCGLHVDDVQTGRGASGRQYDLVPITIVGRGVYQQCARLLHGLCSKYPDMSVLRIDLTGNPAAPADSGKFRFELFWYAAPSGPEQKKA